MLQLLIFMNIMGSLFFVLHTLLLPFERRNIPPEYRVFLYRVNLMFFIIPLPTCIFYIRRYFDAMISVLPVAPSVYHGSHIIVQLEQNLSFAPPILKYYEVLFCLIWSTVMFVKYSRFSDNNKRNRKFNNIFSQHQAEEKAKFPYDADGLVQAAAKELNLKKIPRILLQGGILSPHVSGVFSQTICLPTHWKVSEEVYYMAIKHELAHIRHKDLIFQRIALIARIISWFNPILYALCSKMAACDELTADATACKNVSLTNFKAYQMAILELVVIRPDNVLPAKGFGPAKNKMSLTKERILTMNNKNLNKHKGIKLAATAIMSAVLFSLSTVPALAYTVPPTIETESLNFNTIDTVRLYLMPTEDTESPSLTSMETSESELFTLLNNVDFSKSDWYCVDENGVVTDSGPSTVEPHIIACNHNYLDAQLSYHTKNSDGSCYVDWYSAKKCAKCGHIVETGHIARTKFDKCPH